MIPIGFGCASYNLAIYIANRPADYQSMRALRPLAPAELQHIVRNTSNHWRKVFNVYAKFLCQLDSQRLAAAGSWQQYRDNRLLQSGSSEALLFSPPDLQRPRTVHIVAGKTFAASLPLPPLQWLDSSFAVNPQQCLIVSPYPDYRQLSNERINRLVQLVDALPRRRGS